MILFPIYALAVWYLAMRWRRRFLGFVIPVLGAGAAMLATWVLVRLGGPETALPLGVLLTAEGLVVMSVGLFIACLPRAPSGIHCGHCWYDMQGLEGRGGVCPECGVHRPAVPRPAALGATGPKRPAG